MNRAQAAQDRSNISQLAGRQPATTNLRIPLNVNGCFAAGSAPPQKAGTGHAVSNALSSPGDVVVPIEDGHADTKRLPWG
jgi:hypothetical protein